MHAELTSLHYIIRMGAVLTLMALGPWLWYRAVWAFTRNNPHRTGACVFVTVIILAMFVVLFDTLEVQLQRSATPFIVGLVVFFGTPLTILLIAALLQRRWPPLPPLADIDRSSHAPHGPVDPPGNDAPR